MGFTGLNIHLDMANSPFSIVEGWRKSAILLLSLKLNVSLVSILSRLWGIEILINIIVGF